MDSPILFGRPNLKKINKDGYTAVDMHVHSQYSDTSTKVSKILAKSEKKNFGIAITDHNEIKGALEAIKQNRGKLIIPGIEVGVRENPHLLAYFYNYRDLEDFYTKYVHPWKNKDPYLATRIGIDKLLDHIEGYNALVFAAHPYSPTTMGLAKSIKHGKLKETIYDRIDGIEVINGLHTKTMNLEAVKLCYELKKPFIGGSDSHILFELGSVVTYSKADSVETFLNYIMKKKNFVAGKSTNILLMLPTYSKTLKKHLNYLGPYLKMKYKESKEEIIYEKKVLTKKPL